MVDDQQYAIFLTFYFVICCVLKRIAIVWWWAAGMMAAATICEQAPAETYELHVFEKNSLLGNKVLISGGGRCNVTTWYYKKQDFLGKYIRGSDFLKESLAAFGPRKVYNWFEDHGVPLKLEKDMRVFPVSNDGKDVVGAFEKLFAEYDVRVHFKEWAEKIEKNPQNDYIITTNKEKYVFDIVVLTTGGNAYAHTGSTWDWYTFAQGLGHSITPLWPSLNSFMTSETWMHELSGLSFPDAVLRYTFVNEEWISKEARGPVLLTHFGISWPATFILAAYTAFESVDKENSIIPMLQPTAAMDKLTWIKFLQDAAVRSPKKQLSTILSESLLTKRFAAAFVQRYSRDTTIGEVSKQERDVLAELLWYGIPIVCTQRRPWDEFVTAGGVSLDEVNSSTLESKITPWLYFAGEILDVDGVTGWFNLQACWSAGYVVGKSITTSLFVEKSF